MNGTLRISRAIFTPLFIACLLVNASGAHAAQPDNTSLTRKETAKIISEALPSGDSAAPSVEISDVPKDDPYYIYISRAVSKSFMTVDSAGRFMPDNLITREDASSALYRAFEGYFDDNRREQPYTDIDSVSIWAAKAVPVLTGNGVAFGYPDGSFKPRSNITKQEFNVMISRVNAMVARQNGAPPADLQAFTYQFGAYNAVINYENKLLCHIFYPVTGDAKTDQALSAWARDIYGSARAEIDDTHATFPNARGFLNISYNTSPAADGATKIVEAGTLSGSWLDQPANINRTFNTAPTPAPTYTPTPASKQNPSAAPTPPPKQKPTPTPAQKQTPAPAAKQTPTPTPMPTAPNKHMIALTFDDGPCADTPRLLKILRDNGVKATFCVVGSRVPAYKSVVKDIVNQGCEIIGHSWDHKKFTALTDEEIKKELTDTGNAIYAAANVKPKLYRAPYGTVDDRVKSISKELGYTIVLWSVDTRDWETLNANALYDKVMADVKDGAIILTHEIHPTTVDAMVRIIPELKRRGYQFVTVSELLGHSNKDTSPGSVVHNQ